MVTSDFRPEVEIVPFRACAMKIRNITLIYGRIAELFASYRKSRSRNTMMTSDFRPEVKIRQFHACAMKNTQSSFMAESPNFSRLKGNRGRGTRR